MLRRLALLVLIALSLPLAAAKSPYLAAHENNLVHWSPWGAEAFARAKKEDKPIFLSIGYASCHWCHVMSRESFDNAEIAKLLNTYFVPILVDRQEHPDVDATYIAFVEATTGSAGWPANLVLDADLKPLIGASYMKPDALARLLVVVSNRWAEDRKSFLTAPPMIEAAQVQASPAVKETIDHALDQLQQSFDAEHGGFGSAPKFPLPATLDLLLRSGSATSRDMALKTLRIMANASIHDQIGGGFHRYTTDAAWREPHFEKMLSDQALLAIDYLEAWQLTRDPQFESVARDTLDFILDLRMPGAAGFVAGQDADSLIPGKNGPELVEGAFYLWDPEQLAFLHGDAAAAARYYGIDKPRSLPYVANPKGDITAIRARMKETRSKRPQPAFDMKVIAGWNGLAISALARGGAAFGEQRYINAAREASKVIRTKLWITPSRAQSRDQGRRRADEATGGARAPSGRGAVDGASTALGTARLSRVEGIDALCEDYAFTIAAMLDLFEATGDVPLLEFAVTLQTKQDALFWNEATSRYENGGTLPKRLAGWAVESEAAIPTANSVSASNLLRLGELTDSAAWRDRVTTIFHGYGVRLLNEPAELPAMVAAMTMLVSPPRQIVITGNPTSDDTRALLRIAHEHLLPFRVIVPAYGGAAQQRLAAYMPAVKEMKPIDRKATAYVCEHYVCKLPTSDPEQLTKSLERP